MKPSLLFDSFTKLYRPYIKMVQPIMTDYDLHPAQWLILKDIAVNVDTTLVQISKRRSIEKPTTRKILKALEAREWIVARTGEDRREKLLQLSPKGQDVYEHMTSKIATLQQRHLEALNISEEEYCRTVEILDQLYDSMISHIKTQHTSF
ncbi:MarR family transcriptional regulator [Staphylococcus agnetis]|uniref:MarR family winged helix-turn-helix transcriptional regulator n=1 Tax=Staphylococcus agnetis TaxID=985762 RepID=UPI00208E4809|nr:MarR family transcriptional regulator [Staphylococcus agnetis]MCO4337868.1 MarR family transcriptional regulator [Staphylococcus agnetis]MCO4340444.1 MarR family transcriptional regulator [Staphylococcus agnetis]MCO4342994.1 MarR family transcriptional regulator [Staphylococcus agnetis]MCO4344944.1 MarR family transcriptional regulator [Staphylococcus agnetis]MCO4347406.1 MarR family transcriptional regulator [Staphylococcus agnetis]